MAQKHPDEPALSVFDIFKIGIGPSSSHTLGPWRAALRFLGSLQVAQKLSAVRQVQVLLYGSLAKTGKGHGTDVAVMLGLCGEDPVTFPVEAITPTLEALEANRTMNLGKAIAIPFSPSEDVVFLMDESLPFHPNALTFLAQLEGGEEIAETYYSVGGGFVVKEGESGSAAGGPELPFPIANADDLMHWCRKTGLAISEIVAENELAWRPEAETMAGVLQIWATMRDCIYRGCHISGILPGYKEFGIKAENMIAVAKSL